MTEAENIAGIVASSSQRLVGPHLVAIYSVPEGASEIQQTGTGFLLMQRDDPVLVTAAHCLFGHPNGPPEAPGDKLVFQGGSLKSLGEVAKTSVVAERNDDIAAVRVGGFTDGIPEAAVDHPHEFAPVIALHGYLSRDFRRSRTSGLLQPKPFLYQNRVLPLVEGTVRFKFPRRNFDTVTGKKVVAPYPRGLSGAPILDAELLRIDGIGVAGVFTDWTQGVGFGPSRPKLITLLDTLRTLPSTTATSHS